MDSRPLNLFSGTIDILTRSLTLRAREHEMILNNVANADTPNFKPFAMDVEAQLQKELGRESAVALRQTDPRHLHQTAAADGPTAAARESRGQTPLLRGDGNGVDIDAQMTALARNSLLYKASAQIVGSKFKALKHAITGGTK